MGALAAFQDGFARALATPERPRDLPPELARLVRQPGFSVYRNTVLTGWIDALVANFPAVAALMGEDWTRATCAAYAREHPARDPRLALYGEDLPAFLADFPPAADHPYLPAIATLDRLWSEAHVAADAPLLPPHALAALEGLASARLRLHPSARIAWFPHTAVTIWLDARGLRPPADALSFEPEGQGALFVRPLGAVEVLELSAGGHALLAACAAGAAFGEACAAALAAEPHLDLADLGRRLFALGAFAAEEGACRTPA